MLNGLKNAFRIKELREKILFTIAMLVVYRIGAHVPVPGIPFQGMLGLFSTDNNSVAAGAMALLNLFSGGALSYVSVFSLGIMPYITSSIILQMLQAVVPSLHELAREGEVGQTKITQYSRYLTLALAILNSVVGDGHGGHAQLNGTVDHILDTGCAVEHGENSVIVQMDECHVMSSDAGSCSD